MSRRGYRFFGTATLHRDDDVHREAMRRVFAEEGAKYPVNPFVPERLGAPDSGAR